MSDGRDRAAPLARDLAATAALALYSLAVAAGFARVFSGWAFLRDFAILVIVGHGASFALRRARVSGWLAIPLVGAVLLWLLTALYYADTLSWLLPTGETRDLLRLEVGLVQDQFQVAVAPVLYGAGWATLAGFALILAIVMSDTFAFRAEARGEALVPGGVLFVFIAALGSERLRIAVTIALIAAGVLAAVALRALHDRARRVELSPARRSPSMLLPAAVATAAAIAVLAGLIGPRIPGAEADPLYETRGRGRGVTEVISPLVDIRSRLTNRGDVELFRVNADAAAYWRVTTLPEFDGRTFRIPNRPLERIEGTFDQRPEGSREIRQQIQVLSLGGPLVPAAAEPTAAEGTSADGPVRLRLNRDTNTLVAPDDLEPGDLFTVVSAAPRLTPDELQGATTSSPPDPIFLELPDDLPALVSSLAAEVTAGAATPYDAALALQNWFRSEFRYSLEVQSGHGTSAIESFLLDRVGYCEQFSATFAAMARTLGIPSRVAVGFTPGLLGEDGWYGVLGKNAHAWPELWFDGIGWVPFEPTPGRGAPGAESHTAVPAQQDETPADPSGSATGEPNPNPTAPSTVVPPVTNPLDANPYPAGGDFGLPDELFGSGGGTAAAGGGRDGSGSPFSPVVILVLLGLVGIAPWVSRQVRARLRGSLGPEERVLAAWQRATAAAELAGVPGTRAMTAREWAAATSARLPVAARPMRSLAEAVDLVSYARPGSVDLTHRVSLGGRFHTECELWSAQIDRVAVDTLSRWQRVKRYFCRW